MDLTSWLGLNSWDMPPGAKAPAVASRILDELPPHVGPNYAITMPRKKAAPKQNAYDWKNISRPSWEKPEYDLDEVAKACRVESYAARSIDKHREHVLRHGWDFVGRNEKTVAYIRRRMSEISESMGRPVEREIRKAIRNFIKFSNCFLAWTRNRNFEYKSRHGKTKYRPTGLFSMNPTCMRFRRDRKNRILEWYQVVTGHNDESVRALDCVHVAFDQDEGFILGVPFVLPVLDDILTWRRFEEIAEIMAHKFAFPLYHHKIGDKEMPPEEFDDGTSEIGEASVVVSGMAPEGHLFTSYRHDIEVVGAATKALDLLPMVQYWEKRVLSGLNLSEIDVGRGDSANRSTAETISKGLADRCGEYQNEFALEFAFLVLDELLIEGGYDLTPENRVYMHFPAIDREAKRADETHQMLLYQANAITHDEFRTRMGQLPWGPEEWKNSHFEQIEKPSAIIKAMDEPYTSEAKKAVANRAQPSNQHGTKPTKTKVTRDALHSVLMRYDDLKDPALLAEVQEHMFRLTSGAMQEGVNVYNTEYDAKVYPGKSLVNGFMEDCVLPHIVEALRTSPSQLAANSRLGFYLTALPYAARNYAFARSAQIAAKSKTVRWRLTDKACEECKAAEPMRIRRFLLGQVITNHPACVRCGPVGLEVADEPTKDPADNK